MKSKEQLKQEARLVRTATSDVALRQRLHSLLDSIIDTLGTSVAGDRNITIIYDQLSGFKELFDDMFEKVNIGTSEQPRYAIKAKYDFFSVGSVAAYGKAQGGGELLARLKALEERVAALEGGGGSTPTPTPSEYGVVNTDNHIVVNDTYTTLRYVDDGDNAISNVTDID